MPPDNAALPAEIGSLSKDAFLGGRFHLFQPVAGGFRAGLDALLVASLVDPAAAGRCADLGAGAGAVGFAAACRAPGLEIVLVESDAAMAGLARASIAMPENAALAPRIGVVEADVMASRAEREAAGLSDGAFTLVLTNPPFHPSGRRASPDARREKALVMTGSGFLERWLRTASALLETGGLLAMVARPQSLGGILDVSKNRFGDLRIVPVHPRADRPAHRILVSARRGSHAPLQLRPPLVLHALDGALTPLGAAIGEGEAVIDVFSP